jgi:O-antigen/teichoic acid export membrane protein
MMVKNGAEFGRVPKPVKASSNRVMKERADAANGAASLTISASWLLMARTVSFVFSLALPLFLVRHLNQTEFGLYKQAFLVVSTIVNIVPLGFGMSALYFLPREPEKQRSAVLNILLFNGALSGLVCLALIARPSLLQLIIGGPQLTSYASSLGLVMLLWVIASPFEFIAVACNEMKTAGAIIIFVQVSRTGFVLAAAVFFGSVRALVLAAMLQGAFISLAFVLYLSARFPKFWLHFDAAMMRRQLSYALPLGIAGLLYTLQIDLHNYFVSNRFGPAIFAIYAVGTAQLPLVSMLQEAASSVLIPRISVLQRNGDNHEIIRQMARAMRKLAAAYLPIYAVLLVLGREFIRFLFTDQYVGSWPVFAVNLTLLPLSIVLYDPLCRAFAEQRYFLIRLRVGLVLVIIPLLWFGMAYFGMVGAISAVVAANLAERSVLSIRFGSVLGVTGKDVVLLKDIAKLAVAALVAALVTAFVRTQILSAKPFIILAVCGSVFAIVYVAGVFLLRIPSVDEKRIVRDRIIPMLPAWLHLRRTQT